MRATMGAPDSPLPRKVTRFLVDIGLDRLQPDPSDWTVTLCSRSMSLAGSIPAQTRLQRKALMFEPQVTLKETGTPEAMLIRPADAITTAVVNAAM
jgi:hypothetical protein